VQETHLEHETHDQRPEPVIAEPVGKREWSAPQGKVVEVVKVTALNTNGVTNDGVQFCSS
jgi:hypothetical protein